jgi:hypothetical protein
MPIDSEGRYWTFSASRGSALFRMQLGKTPNSRRYHYNLVDFFRLPAASPRKSVGIMVPPGSQLVSNLFKFIRVCMEPVLVYKACKRKIYLPCSLVPLIRSSTEVNHRSDVSQLLISLSCPSAKTTSPLRPPGLTPSISGELMSVLFPFVD